jgi:hypothetical protein
VGMTAQVLLPAPAAVAAAEVHARVVAVANVRRVPVAVKPFT